MKTVTSEQVVEQFDEYSRLAHAGEKILVTQDGKPWVMLAPLVVPVDDGHAGVRLAWPDFTVRLAPHYTQPANGPTATELLSRDKEDRF